MLLCFQTTLLFILQPTSLLSSGVRLWVPGDEWDLGAQVMPSVKGSGVSSRPRVCTFTDTHFLSMGPMPGRCWPG